MHAAKSDEQAITGSGSFGVNLKSKFAIYMALTLLILTALGCLVLSTYWGEYKKLKQSRQFAELAVLFAELGEAIENETKGPMFSLIFIAEGTPRSDAAALHSTYLEQCTLTDTRLNKARLLWMSVDKEGADAITIARIEEGFRKAEKLKTWRMIASNEGRDLPEEIEKSTDFQSRLAHHVSLGMNPSKAFPQTLWDLSKDGYYTELADYVGSMLLYLSRVTKDADIAREISLHSELLRHQTLMARENGLIAYLISRGARPNGLLSDDIGWLRSLWDRESVAYMNIWSLASEKVRGKVDKKLAVHSFPRVSIARKWLAENWTNNDMANWRNIDASQINSPELIQDLEYSREFAGLQLMRALREDMLSAAEARIQLGKNTMGSVAVSVLLGVAIVVLGFWWLDKYVLRRVLTLSVFVRKIHDTGDMSHRIMVHQGDEIGELESAFNEMIESVAENKRKLEASHSVLESRVIERTSEVNERLIQVERLNQELEGMMDALRSSRDQAERYSAKLRESNQDLLSANQELESFVYSASHDLRTPLRNIVGFVELLRLHASGSLDETATHRVGVVLSEAKRLSTLIDGLLAFFRVGRAELRLEPVFLGPLVEELRVDFASLIGTRKIQWRIGDLPACTADPDLIRQLLGILLDNALKFTARKENAVIELGYLPAHGKVEELVYFVRDNGAGFNSDYSGKLFRVFQRLHSPRDFEGNGIGLANMKRIIVRHGGRVWAEGAPDLGACFYFCLPINPELAMKRGRQRAEEPSSAGVEHGLGAKQSEAQKTVSS